MFDLLQRLGEDICFRCNGKIMDAGSLSIEHKTPWENSNVDLFWDLNNIGFSHLRCNRPSRNVGGQRREALIEVTIRRKQQLGMAFGTACNRLRKMIMFHLLQKLGENVCYKCNGKIGIAGVLSIEHKQPWENNDIELFGT